MITGCDDRMCDALAVLANWRPVALSEVRLGIHGKKR